MRFPLYTSINPKLKRSAFGEDVSHDYQQECLTSWTRAGFDIVSLNSSPEAIANKQMFPEVDVHIVDGNRPSITDFLLKIKADGQGYAGIVNSDCVFPAFEGLSASFFGIVESSIMCVERINFSSTDVSATCKSCSGFDLFAFDTRFLSQMEWGSSIRLGDTWWDYIFPLSFLKAGGTLLRPRYPILFHLDHDIRWDEANFVQGGLLAKDMFAGQFGLPEFVADDHPSLMEFSVQCFDTIKTAAKEVDIWGPNIRAKMTEQLLLSLCKCKEESETIKDNVQELCTSAITAYRLSRIGNRRIGDFLCTIAGLLYRFHIRGSLVYTIRQIGEDLQFKSEYMRKEI